MMWILGLAAISALICSAIWWDAIGKLDDLAPAAHLGRKDFHHWYIGLVLQVFLFWATAWWGFLLVAIGQWMMWDDAHQHQVHVRQCTNGHLPDYHSLWHRFYAATLYKWFGSKVDFNG